MKADAIVGYTYDGENLCPKCCINSIVLDPNSDPFVGMTEEEILDLVAHTVYADVDRQDESSFDSSYFPKVIFASSVEDCGTEGCDPSSCGNTRCTNCGESLI